MPGFSIHLACAKQYIKNHPREIKNEKEFFDGSVAPDFTDNKTKTHYRVGERKYETDFQQFYKEYGDNLNSDFLKGYFFHLVCDELFYGEFFLKEEMRRYKESGTFYDDYDAMNTQIMKKYSLQYVPEGASSIRNKAKELKYFNIRKIYKFIKKATGKTIKNYQTQIKKHNHIAK